jgi:hypothetical protein
MTTSSNNTYEQVYNVHEDENLSSRVAIVICVLVQRGMLVAGFSITKELLTIHYSGYNTGRHIWDIDFFEQVFSSEPLLVNRDKVKGVFVSGSKSIVVPDELYAENDAKNWLKRVHFIERRDIVKVFPLENDHAKYLYAVPVEIAELLKINFKKIPMHPLSMHHFNVEQANSLYLQCCISNEQAVMTLHNYSQLLWHNVLGYSCAEDLAYEIKLLCKENYIDPTKMNIVCNCTSASEYSVINELTQYFPGIKAGDGNAIQSQWAPAISLVHQLIECVL